MAVFSRVGEWYGIQVPRGVPGYVSREDVELRESRVVVRKERIHVRAGSSFAATSLGMVGGEEELQVRRLLGDWVEVEVPHSCRAWVHGAYVTFLEPYDFEGELPSVAPGPAVR